MSTRLMLIRDSAPLPRVRVRVKGVDGEFTSNEDGIVEVPVESEHFSLAVHDTDDWVVRKVRRTNPNSSMIVVDIGVQTRDTKQRWDLTSRYEFERVLGRGGMGVVVRARDTLLERPVAIKMLSDEFLDNKEAQELFLTEGRAMATLKHPNLVTVHDVSETKGKVMMVLEFVDGQNVEELLKDRGSLQTAEALNIIIQALRALEYLHVQGVIHRDLKPGNFMIEPSGTVKVIDFGLARSLEDLYDKGTRVRGTPAYMAPEQILGEKMSPATDLYQVGVTLFELLVGELPYTGAQLYAHVHDKVPHMRDLDATIDPELDDIVWNCLQKDPEQRPRSTASLRANLEAVYYRIATDPNLGTAETAYMVEPDSSGKNRSTEALVPTLDHEIVDTSRPNVVAESTASQPAPLKSDDDDHRRSFLLPVVALIALLALGGFGAVFTGVFDGGEPAGTAVDQPRAVQPAEVAPNDTPNEVIVHDDHPETAFLIARRTVRSSVSASRAGTAAIDAMRAEDAERRESRKSANRKRRADRPSGALEPDGADTTRGESAPAAAAGPKNSAQVEATPPDAPPSDAAPFDARTPDGPSVDAPAVRASPTQARRLNDEPIDSTRDPAATSQTDPDDQPAAFKPKAFARPKPKESTKEEPTSREEADSKPAAKDDEDGSEPNVPVSF